MELWHPPLTAAEYDQRWQACADVAAFAGGFTRSYLAGRRAVHLEAIVLSQAEHQLLWEASAALSAILLRVVEWVQHSPALLPVLGIPPGLAPWITRDPGSCPASLWQRLDWVQDSRGHWWCLEANADTPGGLPEATAWQAAAAPPEAAGLADPNRDLLPALGAVLRRHLPGTAGFVACTWHLEDWDNIRAAAGARGGARVLGGLPDLSDGQVRVGGEPVDSIYRYVPGDWLTERPDLLALLADGFPCVNPGSAVIAQSKALFALLWHLVQSGQFLTPTEREWVAAFVPHTSPAPLAGAWVGKPYWNREGGGIITGAGEGPAASEYIYQERVDVAPVQLPVWLLPTGKAQEADGIARQEVAAAPVVGVYVLEGRPAGYMTRLGGDITDRGAHFAPTFIRA